jgi:hypothetical protein
MLFRTKSDFFGCRCRAGASVHGKALTAIETISFLQTCCSATATAASIHKGKSKKETHMNGVWKQSDIGAPKDGTKVLFLARPAVGGFETPAPVIGYWIDGKWRDCPIAGIPGRLEIEIRPAYWTEIPEL